jgi:hypothetical protein
MIRHLRHADIDRTEWDRRLLACRNALWYARSEVLNSASPGWEALIDDATGALMPLTWRRKYGMRYLFQPFGLQQLGVFAPTVIDEAMASRFISAIPASFRWMDICLNADMPLAPDGSRDMTPCTNHVLDLADDMAVMRKQFVTNHVRNLKTPAPHIVTAQVDETADFLERSIRARFPSTDERGLRSLRRLLQQAFSEALLEIPATRDAQGALMAAVVFITWQGRTILLKSAATAEGRESNAMFHLVDHGIGSHIGRSRVLDFAGGRDPGMARFYAGFGARPSTYFRLRRNTLPFPLRLFKR